MLLVLIYIHKLISLVFHKISETNTSSMSISHRILILIKEKYLFVNVLY